MNRKATLSSVCVLVDRDYKYNAGEEMRSQTVGLQSMIRFNSMTKNRTSFSSKLEQTRRSKVSLSLSRTMRGKRLDLRPRRDSQAGINHEKQRRPVSWKSGRRIFELGVLADSLSACGKCSMPLSLTNTLKETRFGLGSLL